MAPMRTEDAPAHAVDSDDNPRGINARLVEVSAGGETIEVILVLRGKLRAAPQSGRWRIKETGGPALTFAATAVVAARPIARRAPESASCQSAGRKPNGA